MAFEFSLILTFHRSQFIDDVRRVMGIPEWFLHIDSRTTQILHGGACVAFKIHFQGPKAHQLEQDFSRLIASGRLDEPTLFIPGYVNQKRKKTLGYRTCSVRDPNDKNSEWHIAMQPVELSMCLLFLFYREEEIPNYKFQQLKQIKPKIFVNPGCYFIHDIVYVLRLIIKTFWYSWTK